MRNIEFKKTEISERDAAFDIDRECYVECWMDPDRYCKPDCSAFSTGNSTHTNIKSGRVDRFMGVSCLALSVGDGLFGCLGDPVDVDEEK